MIRFMDAIFPIVCIDGYSCGRDNHRTHSGRRRYEDCVAATRCAQCIHARPGMELGAICALCHSFLSRSDFGNRINRSEPLELYEF